MHLVVIPPGARSEPHLHVGYETGIYILEGEVLTRWHEWGALLPLCRSHSRKGDDVWPNGDQGREPWRYADPYQSAMRNCAPRFNTQPSSLASFRL